MTNWQEHINQPLKLENELYAEINKIHDDGTMTGFYVGAHGNTRAIKWNWDGEYYIGSEFNLVPPKPEPRSVEVWTLWSDNVFMGIFYSKAAAEIAATNSGGHVTGPYLLSEDMKESKEVKYRKAIVNAIKVAHPTERDCILTEAGLEWNEDKQAYVDVEVTE